MGAIYRPTYRGKDGVIREAAVWWVRFRQNGQTVRHSTETTDERRARAILREKDAKVTLKVPVSPKGDKLTLDTAAQMIRADYAAQQHKSGDTLEYRLVHLLGYFGGAARLARITTANVEDYKAARLASGAARASINRELACLGRMAVLARKRGLVVPFIIEQFTERNARKGFFEEADLEQVCRYLRPELAALARAAYLTGWRKSELRSRQWGHVDFAAGWLRLEPEETKNREGRQFPLTPELRTLLEAQRARGEAIQKATRRVVPWIFARDDGAPVGDFKRAWATACIKAGFFAVTATGEKVPTKLVHDFRRSAVRNLIRAGIPETTAMELTGHKTRAVFKRYAIVDEAMLKEAGAKLAAAAMLTRGTVEPSPGRVAMLKRGRRGT